MLLAIGLSGLLGTLCRYALTKTLLNSYISLMIINNLGCFLMGIVHAYPMPKTLKEILSSGFISAFTTYSTLILLTHELCRQHILSGCVYAFFALLFGFACLYLGLKAATLFN